MTRITFGRTIGAGATAAVLLLLGSAMPASADAPTRARGEGPLRDLQLNVSDPTDHASAQVVAEEHDGSTTVTLKVQGIDHAAAGETFGAHVHVGPCVEGNGAAALGHYQGGSPVSDETEVWLDFTVGQSGTAQATATVPFVIAPGGAQSVVIHALPTAPDGKAGARMACLPVEF